MSANDKLEKVLRDMHVLISKSEVYSGDSIIVSKSEIFELLDRLNSGVYEIMDEYELTKQSRDRAEREFKRRGDKILFDAERKAEDVYAAAVMYTDEALNHLLSMMDDSMKQIEEVQNHMMSELSDKKRQIHDNQMELKSQLQDLVDTGKYLQLIEDRNKEIKQEQEIYKTRFGGQKSQPEEQFANVKTEIKINKQYFRDHGLEVDDDDEEEEKEAAAGKKGRKKEKNKKLLGKKNVQDKQVPEKPVQEKPRQTLLKTARELALADEHKKPDLYDEEIREEYRDGEIPKLSEEPKYAGEFPEEPAEELQDYDVRELQAEEEDEFVSKFADVDEPEVAYEPEEAYEPEAAGEPGTADGPDTAEEAADADDALAAAIRGHELTEEEIKALSDDLDSEYFDWSGDE